MITQLLLLLAVLDRLVGTIYSEVMDP